MKMKTVVTLKDGTVYEDKNFDKERVAKLIEKLGKLLDTDSIDSIFVTKSILTKEIKEKYFDAFEEAIESIRRFFSEETCKTVMKEALPVNEEELNKLKSELKEVSEEKDSLYMMNINSQNEVEQLKACNAKLEEENAELREDFIEGNEELVENAEKLIKAIQEKDNTISEMSNRDSLLSNENELLSQENKRLFKLAKEVLENNKKLAKENDLLKEESVCLFEEKQAIMHSKLYVENMSLRNRVEELNEEIEAKGFTITGLMNVIERINETKDKEVSTIRMGYMDEISKLKEEIEKYKDLLEQRDAIDNNENEYIDYLVDIIDEQDGELIRLASKIDELMDENAGKDSKIKALELFLANTNEIVNTMSKEINRLNQVIREDSYLVDIYKEDCIRLNKEIEIIKGKAKEIVREYHQNYKDMENALISKAVRKQQDFEKNYNALLLEINSLKKRTLWQRITNKH